MVIEKFDAWTKGLAEFEIVVYERQEGDLLGLASRIWEKKKMVKSPLFFGNLVLEGA